MVSFDFALIDESKKSFKSHDSVFEYLGRYTHKIAISNTRIKEVSNTHVSFEYTDRADNYKKKIRRVEGVKFIKLFLQHVLPKRFMKIRSYGFLSSRNKTPMLKKLFEYFKLTDGTILKNLKDLLEALRSMEEGVFAHHVNEYRNDFANWVRDVFDEQALADILDMEKEIDKTQKLVFKHLINML